MAAARTPERRVAVVVVMVRTPHPDAPRRADLPSPDTRHVWRGRCCRRAVFVLCGAGLWITWSSDVRWVDRVVATAAADRTSGCTKWADRN